MTTCDVFMSSLEYWSHEIARMVSENNAAILAMRKKAPEFCAYCGAVMPPSDKCENCGAPK